MNKKQLILIALFCLIVSPLYAKTKTVTIGTGADGTKSIKLNIQLGEQKYDYNDILVTQVFNGNTLKLENGERVVLIGVDSPEIKVNAKLKKDAERTGRDYQAITAMGKESAGFTRQLTAGKRVKLEFDVNRYDTHESLLAYVYLPDGTFVNAEIMKQGYAQPMTVPPNVKHAELFQQLYKEARENNRGLWK